MSSPINPFGHRFLKGSSSKALLIGIASPVTAQVAEKPDVEEEITVREFNQSMRSCFKPLVENSIPAFAKPDEKLTTDEVLKKYGTDEETMTIRLLSMAKSLPSRLFEFAKRVIFGILQIIPLLHRNGVLVPLMILLIPSMLIHTFMPTGLPGSALSIAKSVASSITTMPVEMLTAAKTAVSAGAAAIVTVVEIPIGAWQSLMPKLTGTLAVIVASIYGIHTFITSGALRNAPMKEKAKDEENEDLIEEEESKNKQHRESRFSK